VAQQIKEIISEKRKPKEPKNEKITNKDTFHDRRQGESIVAYNTRRLYVGKFTCEVTVDMIKELASDIKYAIILGKKIPNRQSCYAFIDFEDAKTAKKNYKTLQKKKLQDKPLTINFVNSLDKDNYNKKRLFVGRFSKPTTLAQIKKILGPKLEYEPQMKQNTPNLSYSFIDFPSEEAAKEVLDKHDRNTQFFIYYAKIFRDFDHSATKESAKSEKVKHKPKESVEKKVETKVDIVITPKANKNVKKRSIDKISKETTKNVNNVGKSGKSPAKKMKKFNKKKNIGLKLIEMKNSNLLYNGMSPNISYPTYDSEVDAILWADNDFGWFVMYKMNGQQIDIFYLEKYGRIGFANGESVLIESLQNIDSFENMKMSFLYNEKIELFVGHKINNDILFDYIVCLHKLNCASHYIVFYNVYDYFDLIEKNLFIYSNSKLDIYKMENFKWIKHTTYSYNLNFTNFYFSKIYSVAFSQFYQNIENNGNKICIILFDYLCIMPMNFAYRSPIFLNYDAKCEKLIFKKTQKLHNATYFQPLHLNHESTSILGLYKNNLYMYNHHFNTIIIKQMFQDNLIYVTLNFKIKDINWIFNENTLYVSINIQNSIRYYRLRHQDHFHQSYNNLFKFNFIECAFFEIPYHQYQHRKAEPLCGRNSLQCNLNNIKIRINENGVITFKNVLNQKLIRRVQFKIKNVSYKLYNSSFGSKIFPGFTNHIDKRIIPHYLSNENEIKTQKMSNSDNFDETDPHYSKNLVFDRIYAKNDNIYLLFHNLLFKFKNINNILRFDQYFNSNQSIIKIDFSIKSTFILTEDYIIKNNLLNMSNIPCLNCSDFAIINDENFSICQNNQLKMMTFQNKTWISQKYKQISCHKLVYRKYLYVLHHTILYIILHEKAKAIYNNILTYSTFQILQFYHQKKKTNFNSTSILNITVQVLIILAFIVISIVTIISFTYMKLRCKDVYINESQVKPMELYFVQN
ncbi:hypothetical protein A3Q56_05825, partial [Intoshia linei]